MFGIGHGWVTDVPTWQILIYQWIGVLIWNAFQWYKKRRETLVCPEKGCHFKVSSPTKELVHDVMRSHQEYFHPRSLANG